MRERLLLPQRRAPSSRQKQINAAQQIQMSKMVMSFDQVILCLESDLKEIIQGNSESI